MTSVLLSLAELQQSKWTNHFTVLWC